MPNSSSLPKDDVMRRFYTGFHADYPVVEVERIALAGFPIEVDGDALASIRTVVTS